MISELLLTHPPTIAMPRPIVIGNNYRSSSADERNFMRFTERSWIATDDFKNTQSPPPRNGHDEGCVGARTRARTAKLGQRPARAMQASESTTGIEALRAVVQPSSSLGSGAPAAACDFTWFTRFQGPAPRLGCKLFCRRDFFCAEIIGNPARGALMLRRVMTRRCRISVRGTFRASLLHFRNCAVAKAARRHRARALAAATPVHDIRSPRAGAAWRVVACATSQESLATCWARRETLRLAVLL